MDDVAGATLARVSSEDTHQIKVRALARARRPCPDQMEREVESSGGAQRAGSHLASASQMKRAAAH